MVATEANRGKRAYCSKLAEDSEISRGTGFLGHLPSDQWVLEFLKNVDISRSYGLNSASEHWTDLLGVHSISSACYSKTVGSTENPQDTDF